LRECAGCRCGAPAAAMGSFCCRHKLHPRANAASICSRCQALLLCSPCICTTYLALALI
jgi:hypothetical protein